MTLKVYNSYSGEKEVFTPIEEDTVKMYVCGPTVYNRVHIGNARPVVVFDTLYRLLKTLYSNVIYARNITDIDDKIMQAAKDNNEAISDISSRYTKAYFDDMAELNNLEPDVIPFATEHVGEMIAMVETLIEKGHAYAAEGHVLFDVKSMDDYGKLAKRSLEDMLAGARVEVAAYKKYAGDFVLWKPSSEEEPGWDSPWGRGRPGWHLECSAMIEKHLGNTIDIHGGGVDLQFPHHENEIAQSTCAHGGEQFVRYWMHNAYINIDGEKMSKSLGNFKMVKDLLDHYQGEVLRFTILSAHYRSELNFSVDALDASRKTLDNLYSYLQSVKDIAVDDSVDITSTDIYQALLDDLNTPIAIRELHALGKKMKAASGDEQAQLKSVFVKVAGLMGLLQQDPEVWFYVEAAEGAMSDAEIDQNVAAMAQARKDKDYAAADAIRDKLQQQGISLTRDGWKRS
ncbi:cysteine--tRNA ligase [Oceanicoccus sagamiensis]|uniref:Cysteine--tRNA ligase n=1 Tax=Oceanicoccus sagamiensis TaxID=716816 RepID=A0A1X9NEW0_9GAMM|nr:cysteine--tRNA ligase [Oceanicoccus sagamiensis]ARN76076.1 cysteine--tRNA ligase [Oceanicoccus sagamiensis]